MIDSVPAVTLPSLARSPRTPLSAGFWDAAREGRLVVQRCGSCAALRHPPTAACYRCQSLEWEWSDHHGLGSIFSYTWVDSAVSVAFAAAVPYNVCVVELDDRGEGDGEPVRVHSNVTGVDRDTLCIGLPVEVYFEKIDESTTLPLFRVSDTTEQVRTTPA